jgi:uncharacterized protein (DUF433 family)
VSVLVDSSVWIGYFRGAETGVRAEVIVGRFVAGETRDELAADLGLDPRLVEEALRWEQLVA